MHGAAFDRAYVKEARRTTTEDRREFAQEARTTRDAGIRAYVRRFAPVAAERERAARGLSMP